MALQQTALVIEQGTTWAIAWPIRDTQDEPIDITGWSVHAQIRPSKDSNDVLYEWRTSTGNAKAEQDWLTLSVSPGESSAWTWRSGVYDVELTDPTGRVARVAEGVVTVNPEVTR